MRLTNLAWLPRASQVRILTARLRSAIRRRRNVGTMRAAPPAGRSQCRGSGRIAFLDGFRGLAILLVIGFHYFTVYARDPRHLVPYGDAVAHVPIFSYGFFGVMLFFSVSGFVIAMTLESSSNLLEFAVRRFARLWPTMLLCSIITYCVLLFWPTLWHQRLIDFLPSLTFMDGHHVWGAISPALQSHWIDDVYWSLFVEVRFYFWAGVVYFISKKHFASNILLLMLVVSAMYIFGHLTGVDYLNKSMTSLFIEPY